MLHVTDRSVPVDLNTRSGLKKVHNNFPQIYRKLDAAYVGAQQRRLEKLMGGIVGIWAKMCSDSILRDKLFNEGAWTAGRCLYHALTSV